LVNEPDALSPMPNEIRRKLGRDDEVDLGSVRLLQVDETPQERLREDADARIPLERQRHEVGFVAPDTQLADETVREHLRPAPRATGVQHFRPHNCDPHAPKTRCPPLSETRAPRQSTKGRRWRGYLGE